MRVIKTDFLIIGSGVAGLSSALGAAQFGKVTLIAKDRLDICNSTLAQGGIAAAIGKTDSPELHKSDTLAAGAGICRPETVEILTGEAPAVIDSLLDWGTRFDLAASGELALGREGAHSLARVVHHGDDTGNEIWQSLYRQAQANGSISLLPSTNALELVTVNGRCYGAIADCSGEATYFAARGVVLATGGCGQLYGRTTNSPFSTGDGLVLAWQAGALLTDLEFMQFHPTALDLTDSPLFLISEAVRGEGAVLVDDVGTRFMPQYHPMADLAPRDVVSRAILAQQQNGKRVYLDATSLGASFSSRFPNIFAKLQRHGLQPSRDWIPVTPAAHFTIGGIKTDSYGKTNVPALLACGEVANTGVHGANRLASNSLLEGLVFGKRVGQALSQLPQLPQTLPEPNFFTTSLPHLRPLGNDDPRLTQLHSIMWNYVGILRDANGLETALQELTLLACQIQAEEIQLKSMLTLAKMITQTALARCESRGSHYRLDYPQPNRAWQNQHLSPGRYSA
ncbi:MAG: L-aspartate oxidase [Peptococcaceae bacterium]|nr:L-aspartate oxidase [Peptococcaceae bacterium]